MNINMIIAIVFLSIAVVALSMVSYQQYVNADAHLFELKNGSAKDIVDGYGNKSIRELTEAKVDLEEQAKKMLEQVEQAQTTVTALKDDVQSKEAIIGTFKDEKEKLDALVGEKNKEIEELKGELKRLQKLMNEPNTELETTRRNLAEYKLRVDELNRELKRVKQSYFKYKENAEQRERKLQSKSEQLKEALSKYKSIEASRDTRDTEQYDGEVLEVDVERRFAVINLGSVNRIKRGMQFDVIRWRFNQWQKMGRIEVTKVFPSTASVAILTDVKTKLVCPLTGYVGAPGMRYSPFAASGESNDKVVELVPMEVVEEDTMKAHDPILTGDKITNPFYSPTKTLAFAIAGETQEFSHEELSNLIVRNGAKVVAEVGVESDYLVLGRVPDPANIASKERLALYQETKAAMETAKQFGVPIMREVELLRMFRR